MYLLKSRYFRCTGTHREICLSSKQFAFCIWRHESKCAHNTFLYSVTQSKSKTQEHCNVHCKFNCITVNVDWTQHGIYNKTVLTLSTSVISFINGGIFSEQKRLASLLPTSTRPPSCVTPRQSTTYVTGFPYEKCLKKFTPFKTWFCLKFEWFMCPDKW